MVETLAGIRRLTIQKDSIKVDMGVPIFDGKKIPVAIDGEVLNYPLEIHKRSFKINCLSVGNPHCVIYLNGIEKFPMDIYGPLIEKHSLFPNRTNVEFVEVKDRENIHIRVWERGVGETPSCGTGAVAASVMSTKKGLTNRDVTVHLKGGNLFIQWNKDGRVFMSGEAKEVFRGEINID